MACDTCGKISQDYTLLSSTILRFLPYKYVGVMVCDDCRRKLDSELDKWRNIAWQKTALMVVDMMKPRPSKGEGKGEK